MSLGIDRPDGKMGPRRTGVGLRMDQDADKDKEHRHDPISTGMRRGLQKEANAKRRQRERELSKADPEGM